MSLKTKIILSVLLIVVAIVGRLIPHAWNFTPLVAVALFAGSYLGARYAVIIPIISMVLSDVFIGFYDWKINLVVYASFALAGLVGLWLKSGVRPVKFILSVLSASTLFFLTTNTAVWLFGTMYSHNFFGLIESLVAGIPFYRNMLIGDLWFSLVLFGSYEMVTMAVKKIKENRRQEISAAN